MFQRLKQLFHFKTPPGKGDLARHQAVAFASRYLSDLTHMGDPDQVLAKAGIHRHQLRSLEFDDEISAAIETRREALIGTPWRLEPNTSRASKWVAEEITPHIEHVLSAAFNALLYGYSVQEVIYIRRNDGRIGLSEVSEKPFEWFEPRQDSQLLYRADDGSLPVAVDVQFKFILTRRGASYRNPLGESLLSRLYWPWFYRKAGWEFWLSWLERFGQPFLVGKAHNPESMAEALLQARQGAAIAVGMEEEVRMESPEAGAGGHFPEFDKVICQRIQKVVLGQTLTSQSDGKGSYALGKVHNDVREDKWRADARMAAKAVQQVVNALWSLNGFAGAAPGFVLADDVGLESERAQRDASLVPVMQASGLRFSRGYYTDRYDIVDEDLEENAAPQAEAAAPNSRPLHAKAAPPKSLLFASAGPGQFDPQQQEAEHLSDELVTGLPSPLSTEHIYQAIQASSNPDELAQHLADLIGDATLDEQFGALLERAIFAADVLGYSHRTAQQS